MRHPEILAPAGTKEAFFAALEAGADAIYAGLKAFNARACAQNFSVQELKGMREITKERGVKLYVVLNSTVKEQELGDLIQVLAEIEWIGADAVILQDLGVLHLMKHHFPRLRPHASTLMTIHNSLGVDVAHRLGFRRVVIAREMTLNEIKRCAAHAKVELECFVFGAMCFTYSGLCLMSSLFGGKASTRGRCVQPCRRIYSKRKGGQGAYFSMLDLNALDLLHSLSEAGIGSFKIEGRLKTAHYVYHAVKAVRTALEAPREDPVALKEAHEIAGLALGRRTAKGFFFMDQRGGEPPLDPYSPPNTGQFIGKIKVLGPDSVTIDSGQHIDPGDRLRFLTRDGRQQCVKKVKSAEQVSNGRWLIPGIALQGGYKGGKVFLTSKKALSFSMGGLPQVRKKGARWAKLKRRIEAVKGELMANKGARAKTSSKGPNVWVRTGDPRDLDSLRQMVEVKGFYLSIETALHGKRPPHYSAPVTWYVPPIILEREVPRYKATIRRLVDAGYGSFQIANIGALALFPRLENLNITASYHLNCMNSVALKQLAEVGINGAEISIELEREAVQEILSTSGLPPVDVVIFGHIPLFTSRIAPHPWLKTGEILRSPKDEEFQWQQRGHVGYLLYKSPFGLLKGLHLLRRLPFRRWVIDLTFGPPGWVVRRRGGGKSILKGLNMPFRRLGLETGALT